MRLRYLHLPRCGPLTDTAVVFGREDRVTEALGENRQGSLNFVVGINGSGKSSVLRVIYRIFRSLKKTDWPDLPVSLAWDLTVDGVPRSMLLHYTVSADRQPFVAVLNQVSLRATKADWQAIFGALADGSPHPLVEGLQIESGGGALPHPPARFRLPQNVVAYTSGDPTPWVRMEHPDFKGTFAEEGQYDVLDERPPGWSMRAEWEGEQPTKTAQLLEKFAPKVGDQTYQLPSPPWKLDDLKREDAVAFIGDLKPLNEVRKKLWNNQQLRGSPLDGSFFLLHPRHLRYAGVALVLAQAATELEGRVQDHQMASLRKLLLQGFGHDGNPPEIVRRKLTDIDWFRPTHLSLTYRDADDRDDPRQHQELLCLVALADEVVAQPRGLMRAVFTLGPVEGLSLTQKLKDAFPPYGIPSKSIEVIAERVDGSKTMAEALLRVFSEGEDIESRQFEVVDRLRDWERTGLLEDLTLTVQRLHRPLAHDGDPDDIVVTYDQLSDGEQMLLGRMGLLFLLRGQDGSLLLLDEPETHFNDVWKREIVEMVDSGLLRRTAANVLVATHTSIALTDAFAAEVTLLSKHEGKTSADQVALPLFGADPGRVLLHVFGAPDMIGVRAAKLLRAKLAQVEWTDADKEALRALIDETGSGWPRAKLMEILERLDSPDAPPGS